MSQIVKPDGTSAYGQVKVPNIEIVGPRLLIYPRPVAETVKGGIIVPEFAQDRAQEAIVLLTGDGVLQENGTRLEPRVSQGDVVIYAKYAGIELQLDEDDPQKYMIIRESDVHCILSFKSPAFELSD